MSAINLEALKVYLVNFCDRYGFETVAKDTFISAFENIAADEEIKSVFFDKVEAFANGKALDYRSCVDKNGSASAIVAEKLDISRYTTDLLFFMCLVPYLEKRYEERGIDKKIFYTTVNDLKWKLDECHKLYGVWGTFVASWFPGFFKLNRFGLGRLQYEVLPWFSTPLSFCGGKMICGGRKFLNVHIPSSGSLNHDEVLESYRQAYQFFKKDFKCKYIPFATNSWLLFKGHKTMLPPESNIRKFMDDYKIVANRVEINNYDFWRIFYRKYDPKNPDYSGETTLQKAYAKHLASGKKMGDATGLFWYNGEKFLK